MVAKTLIMKNMRIIFIYAALLLMWGCKKDTYPGGTISSYIGILDIRNLYKGNDVVLTTDNMLGSNSIAVMVASDHSGGNLPAGLLVVQDSRRLSKIRGISIPLGEEADDYVPGDSLIIHVEGKVLKKVDGILELTGITKEDITKVSSGNTVAVNRVTTNLIIANPDAYESTLSVIVKGGFDPLPAPTDILSGDKVLNDGFGDVTLHTEATASFAQDHMPVSAKFFGIFFNINETPQFRLRKSDDVVVLSSTIEIASVLITGFISDVKGADGNYEYIQLMATKDIDFAATPYAVVVTNNANASIPTGYPVKGWATGGMRTFKLNLFSGTAAKGTFFYVGGDGKMINGPNSTSISTSNWIRAFNYVTNDGDGFGSKTGGLLANSGNAFGMAVFKDTVVTVDSRPVDVIFVSTGGSLYTEGPPAKGYRIANTDFYDVIDPMTLQEQPFYRNGSNTMSLAYNATDLGYFYMLGGTYNPALGKWTKARTQTNVLLTKASVITEIEGTGSTTLK
jgi:hypothetical protein